MRIVKFLVLFLFCVSILNANEKLNIGYSNKIFDITKLDAKKRKQAKSDVKEYFNTFEKRYNVKVSENFYNSDEILKNYLEGKLSIIYLDTATYLKNHKKLDLVTKKYLKVSQGKIDDSPFLLVINIYKNLTSDISELKNSSITMHSHDELSKIYLDSILNKKKLSSSQNFFSNILFKDDYSRVLLNVFFNKAKSCIIPESVYKTQITLNAQIAKKTKVLEKSPPIFKTVALVHNSVPIKAIKMLDKESTRKFDLNREDSFSITNIDKINKKELKRIKNIFTKSISK